MLNYLFIQDKRLNEQKNSSACVTNFGKFLCRPLRNSNVKLVFWLVVTVTVVLFVLYATNEVAYRTMVGPRPLFGISLVRRFIVNISIRLSSDFEARNVHVTISTSKSM